MGNTSKKICLAGVGIATVIALVFIIKAGRTPNDPQFNITDPDTFVSLDTTTYTGDLFAVSTPVAFFETQTPVPQVGTDPLPKFVEGDDPLPTKPLAHVTYTLNLENPQSAMVNFFIFEDEGLQLQMWEAKYIDFTQYSMPGVFMTAQWVGDEMKFQKGLDEGSFGKIFIAARSGQIIYLQMVTAKEYRDATEFAYQTFLGTLRLTTAEEAVIPVF